jgi:hypothetical protein
MTGRVILVIDTSVLCVHLAVPGKETCGPSSDTWDHERVAQKLKDAEGNGDQIVVPIAAVIETGNHIANVKGDRYSAAARFCSLLQQAASEEAPWSWFANHDEHWDAAALRVYSLTWAEQAKQGLSLADVSISKVADYYARAGRKVEILTGDAGLKRLEPVPSPWRRRR